jgi:hypothetical protein
MAGRRTHKKTRIAEWAMRTLIVSFVVILVLLPLHGFISTWGGTAIGPLLVWKSWKEILLLALVPIVVLYCVLRPDVAKKVWDRWLMRLIAIYVLLHIVFAIVSHASPQAVIAGLLMNLRFLFICVLGFLISKSEHPWTKKLWHWAPTWVFVTTIVLSIMAIAQVTFLPKDFLAQFGYGPDTVAPYTVIDSQPNAIRAQATFDGPNPLGAYLLISLAVSLVLVVRQRRNILAGLSLGLGVYALVLTSSRSAWLGAGAVLGVLVLTLVPRAKLLHWAKWGAIPALIIAGGFLWAAMTIPSLRLGVFHSATYRASLTTGSSDKHWFEIENGLTDVKTHLLGQGVGTAGPASYYNQNDHPKIAENYFIQLAQEVGIFGVSLFILISAGIIYLLWQRRSDPWAKALLASFVGITVINFFLHGWADDPTAMTWWGIAGLYLAADNKK